MKVTVTDLLVPGPAAAVSAYSLGHPNRVGSIEVPVRTYVPEGDPWATLVWAHGGSFMRGTLDWPESDWAATRFAEAGVRVVAVDYVLASDEVKAPAPANDVMAATKWAGETLPGPLVLGGASAGANLAVLAARGLAECAATTDAAVESDVTQEAGLGDSRPLRTHESQVHYTPQALVLLYPTLHRVQEENMAISTLTEGLTEERRFRADRIAEMYDFYLGDVSSDKRISEENDELRLASAACQGQYLQQPEVAGELDAAALASLPPTIVVNADADDLRVSGEQFAQQLSSVGVPIKTYIEPGTVHGYMNRPLATLEAEADAQRTIDRFIEELRATLNVPLSSQFDASIH